MLDLNDSVPADPLRQPESIDHGHDAMKRNAELIGDVPRAQYISLRYRHVRLPSRVSADHAIYSTEGQSNCQLSYQQSYDTTISCDMIVSHLVLSRPHGLHSPPNHLTEGIWFDARLASYVIDRIPRPVRQP